MIVITGRMKIPDQNRGPFFELAKRQVELSRHEAGCLNYWLYEDSLKPGHFFFYEEWRDRNAIDFHFKQSYCLEFVKALLKLTDGEPEMHIRTIAEKTKT